MNNQTKTGFERKEKSTLGKKEIDVPSMDRSATYIIESENDKDKAVSKSKSEYTLPRIDSPKTTVFQSKLVPPKPIKPIGSSSFSSSKSFKLQTTNNNNLQTSFEASDDNNNNKSSQESDSTTKSNRQLSKTVNLTALKQQKKAELLKSQSNKNNQKEETVLNVPKNLDLILKHARKSGQLNLSDFGFEDIPKNVWMINNDKMNNSLSMDEQGDESFKWWDQIELSKVTFK